MRSADIATCDRRAWLERAAMTLAAGAAAALPAMAADVTAGRPTQRNPFFAFDNGTGRGVVGPVEQAKMLKDLGYDGIGYTGTADIPAMLDALARFELKMFSTYVHADVGGKQASYDPGLPEAIRQLKGHGTVIWLHVTGKGPQAEARAVALVQELADKAALSGLSIVTYPHAGNYVGRIEDSVRIAKAIGRPNVGASFNLCHWLKVDSTNLETRLKTALPYLRLVSINGADSGNTRQMGWDRLIQPLGRGSYDVKGVLKLLWKLGYAGPVGLQCYNVPGDRRANLLQSIKAWRAMCVPS